MSKFWIAILAALGLALSACTSTPPQTEEQQMAAFVAQLEQKEGFTIDKVLKLQADGRTAEVKNIGWETEDADKTRKIGSKKRSKTIKKGTRLMEVVVVLAGNCKGEFERVKDTTDHYFDEGRNAQENETAVDAKFDIRKPSPSAMQKYFTERGEYDFCDGKQYTVSTKPVGDAA